MTLLALAVGGRGLVDPDEPILHVDDEAFLRSRAAFETTRVYGGRPFKLEEHLARLAGSAARVEIGRIDTEELTRLAGLALEAAAAPDAMLRLFVTPGRDGAESPTQVAMVSTLPEGLDELRERGIKLVSIQLGLDPSLRASAPWLLGGVKSTSYAVNRYLKLSLEALNLLNTAGSGRVDVDAERRAIYNKTGRTFLLGARFSY